MRLWAIYWTWSLIMSNNIHQLESALNLKFNNTRLLEEALIHRSYLNENTNNTISNERLEFLGDAVLELLVSKYLYLHFPEFSEGKLTNLRSAVVNTKSLAEIAQSINLGDYLRLSKGEETSGGRSNKSLLADVFEAVLGAMFLDQGLSPVEVFLEKHLLPLIDEIVKSGEYNDYKSILQERIQEKHRVTPLYKVIKEEGPDHDKTFFCAVYIEKERLGEGSGKSKQEAEQEAARSGLEALDQK